MPPPPARPDKSPSEDVASRAFWRAAITALLTAPVAFVLWFAVALYISGRGGGGVFGGYGAPPTPGKANPVDSILMLAWTGFVIWGWTRLVRSTYRRRLMSGSNSSQPDSPEDTH
jgi:hypothetical protein